MRKFAETDGRSGQKVLQRRSFFFFSWAFTLLFGLAAITVIGMASSVNGGPLAGAAACFGTIAIARRIFGSNVILGEQLIVVNPIFTHQFPYRSISGISSRNGTLTVTGNDGRDIRSTAFGGSIIDLLFGSTDKAIGEINKRRRLHSVITPSILITRNVTRSWIADISLVLSVVSAVAAAIIGV